jgi:hypothetical protein
MDLHYLCLSYLGRTQKKANPNRIVCGLSTAKRAIGSRFDKQKQHFRKIQQQNLIIDDNMN